MPSGHSSLPAIATVLAEIAPAKTPNRLLHWSTTRIRSDGDHVDHHRHDRECLWYPIPRLTVSAIRTAADGTEETVSSAATDENGSYVLPVLPGSIVFESGDGFPTFTTDKPDSGTGQATNQESPITTAGSLGTIRGQILVETGDDDGPTEFGVAAETWVNDAVGQAVTGITTTINTDGSYTLAASKHPQHTD